MVSTQTQKPVPAIHQGTRQVVYGDNNYPANLEDATAIAMSLWYRGTLRREDRVAVAIVGSRECSSEGKKRAFKLAHQLAAEGVTVVSGLALGVDAAAHRGALAAGGRTLAVLGTGLNHIYPSIHQELAREIEGSGALLSQYFPIHKGSRGGRNFLKRNHVIAALAQVLVVVEGEPRSGTIAAVRAALAQKRPVGLLRSLVEAQPWAQELIESGRAFPVESLDDVVGRVSF